MNPAPDFWQRATKASIDALALSHGQTALDIGCGSGEATRHMAAAAGAALGIDTSASAVEEATRLTGAEYDARFERAGADDLPFDDNTFAGVRIDRALQHVEDLGAATEEIWRVTAPNGRIAAIEPDWDTLVFDAGPLNATRAVARAYADGIRNPIAGRQLARRLRKLGATGVTVEPRSAAITTFDQAEHQYDLTSIAEAALGKAGRAWLNTLRQRDAEGTFLCAVTYFFVRAQKPAP
jgi:ubiquinone/menaquinone biosynthesis C-methylase UbiE